jgi:hypothetical protein
LDDSKKIDTPYNNADKSIARTEGNTDGSKNGDERENGQEWTGRK